MKVGIVTLHRSYSYGACFQSYATYKVLQDMGYDAEFVNYVNSYEQNQNHLVSTTRGFARNIMTTTENIFLHCYSNNKKAFDKFHNNYKQSNQYRHRDDMDNLCYDVLLSGSDQLWNPDIFNQIDSVFFLNFGKARKRIAYAASAGSHIFTKQEREQIAPWVNNYSAIGVREEALKKQLEELTDKDISIVLDPTFLLEKKDWLSLKNSGREIPKDKFILLYMIGVRYSEYREKYAPIVKFYADQLEVPVYAVTSMTYPVFYGADKNLCGITPEGLVQAINSAELIITSSFHGIAFSINLNRRFIALKNSNPARTEQLLQYCGLEDRIIDEFDEEKCTRMLENIDYSITNKRLSQGRNISIAWLRRQLEE